MTTRHEQNPRAIEQGSQPASGSGHVVDLSLPALAANTGTKVAIRAWRSAVSATISVAQHDLLHYTGGMPVTLAHKVEALRADFRSAAQLANLLGVDRSQVMRWLRGAGIDPLNAEKVDLLELVWSNLLRLYDRDAALSWLFGVNPSLGDRRPVDLIRMGRAEELMRAIRAERSDSFA